MRRNSLVPVLVVLVLVVGVAFFLANRNNSFTVGQPPGGTGSPADVAKPNPIAQTFHGCPPSGDGGDPALNILKNRVDEGPWQSVTLSSLLALTWPMEIERQPRS